MGRNLQSFDMSPAWEPPVPKSVEETGLNPVFIQDLVLKVLYFQGQLTGNDIAEYTHLPFTAVISPTMDFLKREQMCEVKGAGGLGAAGYQYVITNKGATRVREQLERTTYVGPAPVAWDDYIQAIKKQSRNRLKVTPSVMQDALSHLVLEPNLFNKIGPAANSGKSIFLYGPPGNGKTTIAEAIGKVILTGDIYIPYAVEVDGQIIQVYDQINHVVVEEEPIRGVTGTLGTPGRRTDARWIRIKRPVIMVGGELTLEGLDLIYDPNNRYYQAPFQMKANGGMFLIDDFGRQQVRPRDLLNRWIVPMEKKIDFLALHTGRKVEVPFEVLLVFSTNLPPKDLVDEAFLRRIRHKIEVSSPSFEGYREIFRRMCQVKRIPYDETAVVYLLQEYYVKKNRKLRSNHPRDLLEQMIDIADYMGVEPHLTKEMIDQATASYFVDL